MPGRFVLQTHVLEVKSLMTDQPESEEEHEELVNENIRRLVNVVTFLKVMFSDNPWWSETLARAHASYLAVWDHLLTGAEISDVDYSPFITYGRLQTVMPMGHKLRQFRPMELRDVLADLRDVLYDWTVPVEGQFLSHEGVEVLMWHVLVACRDVQPHLEDYILHNADDYFEVVAPLRP